MNISLLEKFKKVTSVTLIFAVVFSTLTPAVFAAISGPNNAGTGSNISGVGWSTSWNNPSNIVSEGSPYASKNIPGWNDTNYLRGTNYSFSVPNTATITGITVIINRQWEKVNFLGTDYGVTDNIVRLVKNGAIIGDNKWTTSLWPTSFSTATYGGVNDLWWTSWTPNDINNTGFGVVLSAHATGISAKTAEVDYIKISISYSLPSDTTAPTITNITSTTSNGTYGVGTVIPLNVTFSETVTSAGNVTLTTDTGRTCTFAVTSSTTGSCNYTVQAGDNTSDLNISTVSGTITDGANLSMVNFTPTTNLATNKAIVIDTTAPSVPTNTLPNGTTVNTDGWDFTWNASTDNQPGAITYEYQASQNPAVDGLGVLTTGVWSSGSLATNMIHSAGAAEGVWYWQVRAKDAVGNYSTWSPVATVTKDTIAPVVSTDGSFITVWPVSAAGADITYGTFPTAIDAGTPNPTVNCTGTAAHFALNSTNDITCSATDAAGNTGSQTFTVIISDVVIPTLSLPGNITVPSVAPAGATVTFNVSATDDVDTFPAPATSGSAPAIVCNHLSGETYSFGTTMVTCTATDSSANFATGSFSITVSDTVAPTVSISLSDTNINATDTSLVTFTFSEAPVGFDNADVDVQNGSLDTITGSGTVYTATFTPTASVQDSTNVITVGTGWSDGNIPTGNAPTSPTVSTNYVVDTTAPIISWLVTNTNSPLSAAISFMTNENTSSTIQYGLTNAYGTTTTISGALTQNHAITLMGLTQCDVYHYSLTITDASGNTYTSPDASFQVNCNVLGGGGGGIWAGPIFPSLATTNSAPRQSTTSTPDPTTNTTNTEVVPASTSIPNPTPTLTPESTTTTPAQPNGSAPVNNIPSAEPAPTSTTPTQPTAPVTGRGTGGTTGGTPAPAFNSADATLDQGGGTTPENTETVVETPTPQTTTDIGGWVAVEESSYTLLWTLLGLIALLNTWWFFVAKNKPDVIRRD